MPSYSDPKNEGYLLNGTVKGTTTSFKELVRMAIDCAADCRLGSQSNIEAVPLQPGQLQSDGLRSCLLAGQPDMQRTTKSQ